MKILHLFQDEKFVDFVMQTFLAAGENNRFVMLSGGAPARPHKPALQSYTATDYQQTDMARDLQWCDCLIVHYLNRVSAQAVVRAPAHVTVLWSGWGRDYYDLIAPGRLPLHEAQTAHLLASLAPAPVRLLGRLAAYGKYRYRRARLGRAVQRADFFSAPIPQDFALLQTHGPGTFRAHYVQLNYGDVASTFSPGPGLVEGSNILVGNSATSENNHLDAFSFIKENIPENVKIITPLSYGDTIYRDAVIEKGNSLFGDRFLPLTEFMNIDEYNTILASCNVAIMNHRRQQALGNIGALLHKGGRVFMNPANPAYDFLRKLGALVWPIDALRQIRLDQLPVQDPVLLATNRAALERFWGQAVIAANLAALIETIAEHRRRDATA